MNQNTHAPPPAWERNKEKKKEKEKEKEKKEEKEKEKEKKEKKEGCPPSREPTPVDRRHQ